MTNAPIACDFYKTSHHNMYAKGTEKIYSNFTPRSAKLFKGSSLYDNKVVNFGLQMFIKDYLIKEWNETFFSLPKADAVKSYKRFMDSTLGKDSVSVTHVSRLHGIGYLPITIKALPEGTRYPIGVPCLTITNTIPEFYWLTNYLESVLSTELWKPTTAATIAYEYRRVFEFYADKTGASKELIPFQGHDFSFRGMSGRHDAQRTGIGHLTSFIGTDTCLAIDGAEQWYNADIESELVGTSVPATEHSIMTQMIAFFKDQLDSCGEVRFSDTCTVPLEAIQFDNTHTNTQRLAEIAYIWYLITELYPTGIISIVADSFDFWYLMEYGIKVLKPIIESRDGKVVFRPDSGNPIDIICGDRAFIDEDGYSGEDHRPEYKGAIECLYDTFGYTTNNKGYKVLSPKVGLIYGDSITIERQEQILSKLADKYYATDCIVLGIGSFSLQYITRDTLGFAMKATYTEINGKPYDIYKDPKTANGSKTSAKGLLCVMSDDEGNLKLKDQCKQGQEALGVLQTVFTDGQLLVDQSLHAIRSRLKETK